MKIQIHCPHCKKEITKHVDSLAGQRAGAGTLKKYGKEHFSKIAKERWAKKKAQEKSA